MEGVFKKLSFCSVTLANLFDLYYRDRFARRMAKSIVNPPAAKRILRPNDLRILGWPTKRVEKPKDDALRYRCFIGEAASHYALTDCLNV